MAGIVNASNYAPGPFAPNSVISIFGTNLSWSTHALAAGDISGAYLPYTMANVQVLVDNWPAALLYVSPTQINLIIPSNEIAGDIQVRVVREGVSGPEVTIKAVNAAPALFDLGGGYAIATHADNSLITPDSPARPGETIVVYATGLGATQPNTPADTIPQTAAQIVLLSSLKVTVGASSMPPVIRYAGVTPFAAGLYQINLDVPADAGTDPQFQVTIQSQSTPTGVKLAVRPAQPAQGDPQPTGGAALNPSQPSPDGTR